MPHDHFCCVEGPSDGFSSGFRGDSTGVAGSLEGPLGDGVEEVFVTGCVVIFRESPSGLLLAAVG